MKIIQYCQHVLGIGHFFRSLEIARALWRHQLTLVTGGPLVKVGLPEHVTEYRLPSLEMDADFTILYPTDGDRSLLEIRAERRTLLRSLFEESAPDLFLVELYPFGRKRFGFELLPLFEAIRKNQFGPVKVVCSLRDILVEKEDREAYEQQVIRVLNRYFDALLVHSDPSLVSLEETFQSIVEIKLPVVYTGFITPRPQPNAGAEMRDRLGIGEDETLTVASVGGGKVGYAFLKAVLEAHALLRAKRLSRLQVFTGPFMAEAEFASLLEEAASGSGVQVVRFTEEFLSFLAGADLSVSMAGYNTCMNILAARVPALVWPFGQNREQRLRAEKLAARGALTMLSDDDLAPSRLAKLMEDELDKPRALGASPVKLDGALETARWLESCYADEGSAIL